MKGLLIGIASLCLLVWASLHGYAYYKSIPASERGQWAYDRGDYAAAIPYFEIAHSEDASDHHLTLKLAECYDKTGDPRMACHLYRAAQDLINDTKAPLGMRRVRDRFLQLQTQGY